MNELNLAAMIIAYALVTKVGYDITFSLYNEVKYRLQDLKWERRRKEMLKSSSVEETQDEDIQKLGNTEGLLPITEATQLGKK